MPSYLVGQTLRLSHLIRDWAKYVDQVVTVSGWARETRLASKDTLLFIKLVDGSSPEPIQVVIENKIPNWEDVQKAKISYSFKLTGKIEKSVGKGQQF
jgi:asparaginyl-tRNA synthetase